MEHNNFSTAGTSSSQSHTRVDEVYQSLLDRAPENTMQPRLEAVRRAVEILGSPEKSAPVIHITGTNGKTSTARMIERLLLAHDLRTGRYTSPHLTRVTERISIDGTPVSDSTFVRIWEEIEPYIQMVDRELAERDQPQLTYFEALTVLAFAIFADAPVDVMVLEVGIGGVWDATNIAEAQVSVITPIGFDHTDMLGTTLADIAAEKQGIIKDNGFLVSAAQDPEAAQILLDSAREHRARFCFEGVEFGLTDRHPGVGGQLISIRGLAGNYNDVPLPLFGAHQAHNAAVALAAVEAFIGGGEHLLNIELVRAGWQELVSPGRLEIVRSSPTVIVDAAHNPHGVAAAARAFTESFAPDKLTVVIGVLRDKDARGIFEMIRREYIDSTDYDTTVFLTESTSPRAIPAEELRHLALDAGLDDNRLKTFSHLPDALEAAIAAAAERPEETGAVLVTGSITVVGQVRELLGL